MTIIDKIVYQIVQPIVYLLIALATLYFVWGVFIFIKNADNPTERTKGFNHMKWGIVGLFIMVSAVGIMNIIKATLGVN